MREITASKTKNFTNRVYKDTYFDTHFKRIIGVMALTTLETPALEKVEVRSSYETISYDEKTLSEIFSDTVRGNIFAQRLKEAECITYYGSFEGEKLQIVFDRCVDTVKVSYTGNVDARAILTDLTYIMESLNPELFAYDSRLYEASVNFMRGTITFNQTVTVSALTTKDKLMASILGEDAEDDGHKNNVLLQVPVTMLDYDWVMNFLFNQTGTLALINMRLIIPQPDGYAKYTDLTPQELSESFDKITALLDKETGSHGAYQTVNGMRVYGYEKLNVMAFKDTEARCAGITMLFDMKEQRA